MHVHTASRCICETEKWNGGGREGERVSAGEMERGRERERDTHAQVGDRVQRDYAGITWVLRGQGMQGDDDFPWVGRVRFKIDRKCQKEEGNKKASRMKRNKVRKIDHVCGDSRNCLHADINGHPNK